MAHNNKLNEKSLLLSLVGFLFLTPPLLLLFNVEQNFHGIPAFYLYSFSIWGGLIFISALLSRHFFRHDNDMENTTLSFHSPTLPPSQKTPSSHNNHADSQ